jgi:branched-chain amino acid transport system substrate-binding protein
MGGNVVGTVRHPLNTFDFSSFLLQAQNSGAQVVAFANAGTDFSTVLKQSQEFGITEGQSVASMLVFLSDLRALGLEVAKGIKFTTAFYWDYNSETRAFAERFHKQFGVMPTDIQAGAYSATMTYLNAVNAAGSDDAAKVREQLRSSRINDFFAKNGRIRDDGRMIHEMYLAQAKAPTESKSEWDLMKILRPIPGDEAFMPLDRSTCPLVKK